MLFCHIVANGAPLKNRLFHQFHNALWERRDGRLLLLQGWQCTEINTLPLVIILRAKSQRQQLCVVQDEVELGSLGKKVGLSADSKEAACCAASIDDGGCGCAHGMLWQMIWGTVRFPNIHKDLPATWHCGGAD